MTESPSQPESQSPTEKPITFEAVRAYPKVQMLMDKANEFLGIIGYTEHGHRHGKVVGKTTRHILESLGDNGRVQELGAIAGYLHDIGNVINRDHHAQAAIGNHHEEDGLPISRITAALIIADKADVHRSRVRTTRSLRTDIHDRVNYAVTKSVVTVDPAAKEITLNLTVDTRLASVMEYFEIFMSRMLISKKAANFLKMEFHLDVNGTHLL